MKFCLLFIVLAFACKAKNSTEDDLKNVMQSYLYSQVNNDSTKVKYNVQKVVFFYDDNKYLCEFNVHMREFTVNMKTKFDTTGIMKATISKDFKTVTRTY